MTSTTEIATTSPTPPNGFYLKHNAVSPGTWNEIRDWLNLDLDDPQLGLSNDRLHQQQQQRKAASNNNALIPWEASTIEQNRPVAQFGFRYDYEQDKVDRIASSTPPIPPLLVQKLLHQLDDDSR